MVFERFDRDVRQLLKASPLKVSGMRHVLRCVLAALAYMHKLGFVHADPRTANISCAARVFMNTVGAAGSGERCG